MKMFVSNAELEQQEEQERQAGIEQPVLSKLTQLVLSEWQKAKMTKEQKVEPRMLRSLRARAGEYDVQTLAAIREAGGSEIFMRITDEKCIAAEAYLGDALLTHRPWKAKSTPVPELRQEQETQVSQQIVQQSLGLLKEELQLRVQMGEIQSNEQATAWLQSQMQAEINEVQEQIRVAIKQAAHKAEDVAIEKIDDVLVEGEWYKSLKGLIYDVVTFPTGFLKGPVIRNKKVLKWKEGLPDVVSEPTISFNVPSPFDIYPLSHSVTLQDGLIERHRMSISDLNALMGVPGYNTAAIIEVINECYNSGSSWLMVSSDHERESLQNRPYQAFSGDRGRIDALQYWGRIPGRLLIEYGFRDVSPIEEYACEIWLIDRHIIKVELNGDPLGRIPYHGVSYREQKGSIWGNDIPDLIEDTQTAANGSGRNIMNNMAASAGPQSAIDVNSVQTGEDMTGFQPFRVWLFNSAKLAGQAGRKPVEFFVPPSVVDALIKSYQFFSQEADNRTGLPKYAYGSNSGSKGITENATAFSMMLKNALMIIKQVVDNFDAHIIAPSIQHTYELLLLFWRCPELMQGDIKLQAVGARSLIHKDVAQMRRKELLQVVLGSEWAMQQVGDDGGVQLLRDVFETSDLNVDDILPSRSAVNHKSTISNLQQRIMLLRQQSESQQTKKTQQVTQAGMIPAGKEFQQV
jgi:hypothetical protein